MTTSHTADKAQTRASAVLLLVLRIIGAGLLGGMAWIHYDLWTQSGSSSDAGINFVVALFLVNAIVGALLAIAVLVIPGRMLSVTAAVSSLFTFGTLMALLVSIWWGLFGYTESFQNPLVPPTIVEEVAAVIVLAVLAVFAGRANGMWSWVPGNNNSDS